jgi:TRAP-type C4-dicarboxylate transport system permease small subunit
VSQERSRANKTLETLAEWMALAGGFVVFLLMLMVAADAIGRKIWSAVPGALEFSETLMVPAVFLPLMFVQMKREHVFVGVVTDHLRPQTRAWLNGIAAVVGIVVFGFLTWLAFDKALQATIVGEYRVAVISVPIWPFRWFIPLGTGLMVFQLALMAYEEFRHAMGGEPPPEPSGSAAQL